MSENLNPKELPHELLMRKYSLKMSSLSQHTQKLKKDLDRTLHLVINKSKNGVVNLTPNTQNKIEAYDRYICDGIFEYLDEEEVITEEQGDTLGKQMDEKRDDVVEKMEKISEEQPQSTQPQENQEQKPNDDDKGSDDDIKVGSFWDWG